MKKKFLFIFFVIFNFFLFLSGCYEQEIIVYENLEGQITYKIEYNDEFNNYLNLIDENSMIDINSSVLFDKQEFRSIINKDDNTSILAHNISIFDHKKTAEAVIRFKQISRIPRQLPIKYFPTAFDEEKNNIICTTVISFNNNNMLRNVKEFYIKMQAKDRERLDKYISLIFFYFIFKTPGEIISNSHGKLSDNKKTLEYKISLYNLLNSKNDILINFVYKK